ncbi:MAG TPA: hypothetical protein VFJ63_02025 [Candidatus Bathyarchaeia archaeon]|nr:hypothetical protein [Candidatus Bathyarchaeia archaeon]
MSTVQLSQIKSDSKTSANQSELRIGQLRIPLPNRFPISQERNALKPAGVKDPLPGEVTVQARLAPPETVKKILTQEDALKSMAKFLSKETGADAVRMLYLAFKGGAVINRMEDLKTILDLQYLAGLDIITVQHSLDISLEDYDAQLKFADRWADERGVNKPIMPIIQASDNKETAGKLLDLVEKHEASIIGFDLRGGFYYHALRGIEEFKKRKPEIWIHAFQTPPKVRFGRGLLTCSEGMILPMFGIDSFSRWIVPPPPTPLTKEVINVFDRKGWGSMKKKDYEAIRKNTTNCNCAVCQGKDLEPFYEGKVLDVLAKAKVHDHLAQRQELETARESIKKGQFLSLLNTKEYPREFLKQIPNSTGTTKPEK